jgi:hypothetical protein
VDPATVPADKASATPTIEIPATGIDAKDYTLALTGKTTGIADKTAPLKVTASVWTSASRLSLQWLPSPRVARRRSPSPLSAPTTTDAVRLTTEPLRMLPPPPANVTVKGTRAHKDHHPQPNCHVLGLRFGLF